MNPKYKKLETETDYEYGLRLIEIKVEQNPPDLDWNDIVEMTGLDVHYDSLRKAANVTPYSGYNVMKYFKEKYASASAGSDNDYLDELEQKMLEFRKERQRFFDQRNALSKVVRDMARQDENTAIFERAIESGAIPKLEYMPAYIEHSDNDLLVSLNDLHYGAFVDNYWNYYNSDVCRCLLRDYLDRIHEIADLHKAENCYVWANGDLISGNIHKSIAVSNRENVIQQVVGVSELIAEFLAELSRMFKHVYFSSVAGNHSRIEEKDLASPHERLDDLIEWYLRARLQNFDTVGFDHYRKIDDTMYLLDIRGKTYLGVHGDYDGSPGKIQALQSMAQEPVYAVLSGHLHHNKVDNVQGIKTVMAGSFLGMDDYCVGKRIYGAQQQLVCVCTCDGIKAYYDTDFNTNTYRPVKEQ
ncbi:MAG: metallophosphoesterase family protein [Lachnospiraceae bacterium]|nr:metallophosphoesterase family protein [Lachnospiraceae bacterium]